jgi:hypothetical protein
MPNVYGNNGNRWWVGLNVGSDQSTVFGTGSILSPNGYESLPSGNATDDRLFAAAAARNRGAAKPNTISVENVSWYNINGPYPNQAAANAAIPAIQAKHPAPGAIQQITAGSQNTAANGGGFNPTAITDFLGRLTDANLWLRVGEFLLGALLIFSGAMKLSGANADIGSIAKKVIK